MHTLTRASIFILLFVCLHSGFSQGWAEGWSPLAELSFAPQTFQEGARPPQIGVDGNGNAFAVWVSKEPLGCVIKAARYDSASKEWGFPKRIGMDNSKDPHLAVTRDGKAIVVWCKEVDGRGVLYYSAYQNEWGPENMIEAGAISNDSHPSVGVDDNQHAIVVWQSQPDDGANSPLASVIRSATFHFSTYAFGVSSAISTNYSQEGFRYVGQPEVAVNAYGQAVAVWRYHDGGATQTPFRIQSNVYRNGLWQSEIDVSVSFTTQLILPIIAINAHGEAMAVWLQTGHHYYVVTAAMMNAKGWDTLFALSDLGYVESPIDADQGNSFAHVVYGDQGNAMAAWSFCDESLNPPLYKVQARSYEGSTWNKTADLYELGSAAKSVRTALDASGNSWVVFASVDRTAGYEDSFKISASRFLPSIHNWCLPDQLTSQSHSVLPNIACNANGHFHSVWVSDEQGFGIIKTARWVPDLPPVPPSTSIDPPPPILLPQPPRNVKGEQVKNVFVTHVERHNIITWDPPIGGSVPYYYRIYRDSSLKDLIAEIRAGDKLKYVDTHRIKGKTCRYYLVTVDHQRNKSNPVRLIVRP